MKPIDRSPWLLFVGLAYALVPLGMIVAPVIIAPSIALFFPLLVVFPVVSITIVLVLRGQGTQFHGVAITAFVLWVLLIACLQLCLFAQWLSNV